MSAFNARMCSVLIVVLAAERPENVILLGNFDVGTSLVVPCFYQLYLVSVVSSFNCRDSQLSVIPLLQSFLL